jgi:uncharacterized protein
MRRKEKNIESKEEIEQILKAGKVIRVAFAGKEPYLLPFNYGYEDGKIYIHCAKEGKKLELIKNDARVAFEVSVDGELKTGEISCGYGYSFRCVLGKGKARLAVNEKEVVAALDAIMLQQAGITENKYRPETLLKTSAIIIDIIEMTGKKSGI